MNSSNSVEKALGKWVLNQRNLSQNIEGDLPWKTFINSAEFFSYFNEPVSVWKFNLETLKFFIKENGKHPSPATQDVNERRLAIWAERNRYLLKQDTTRRGIMKNDDVYRLWCAFES